MCEGPVGVDGGRRYLYLGRTCIEKDKQEARVKETDLVWCIRLLIIVFFFFNYMYVCECTVGVDVGDGTIKGLMSIRLNIAMGCIVFGRQVDVYFTTSVCKNAILFVGMDVRFCTMKTHDSINTRNP